jgi:hypothetical protein
MSIKETRQSDAGVADVTRPVDHEQPTPTDGSPVGDDRREFRPDDQHKGGVMLSEEERARGFVRHVRQAYRHIGIPGPKYPLRELTTEERQRHGHHDYVKFEEYPEGSPARGRFWTQERLDKIGKGCGGETTVGRAIAETYARDPGFYGATFCRGCGRLLPVGVDGEFVWDDGSDQRVGT